MMYTVAIILSAGEGKRIGAEKPKQYLDMEGKPIIWHSLKAFDESDVSKIIIVCAKDDIDMVKSDIVDFYGIKKVSKIVSGGRERYDSVYNGLIILKEIFDAENIPEDNRAVLIHDSARPFIKTEVINKMIKELDHNEALIAGMPVKDTIKLTDDKGIITATTERKNTWAAQTPQCFKYELIMDAYDQLMERAEEDIFNMDLITDDAMVLSGIYPEIKIRMFEAGYENIKITTPDDLKKLKQID